MGTPICAHARAGGCAGEGGPVGALEYDERLIGKIAPAAGLHVLDRSNGAADPMSPLRGPSSARVGKSLNWAVLLEAGFRLLFRRYEDPPAPEKARA